MVGPDTLATVAYVTAQVNQYRPAGVPIEATSQGQRISFTRDIASVTPGTVTIISGHGRFYMGHVNGVLVMVEVLDAAEVATITPGTTLLVTET